MNDPGVSDVAISVQFGVLLAGAIISAALIVVLRPLLARYALARPNARSLYRVPTPQGGGIAVIAATIIAVAAVTIWTPQIFADKYQLAIVLAAAAGLALVGVTDDVRPLEALPRLLLQTAAVGVVIAALPVELRVFPVLPWWIERLILLIGGIWFVNLVNFMDGIDWMTVAEVVPLTAALAFFGLMGALPQGATFVAVALCGATIGFAPFNRPVARLFLGDVGSLPIGLAMGWLLVLLGGSGHLTAALLLPLYYLADATITLVRRLANHDPIMQAHRSHFYQRAIERGLTAYQVVSRVFLVNIALIGLAAATVSVPSRLVHAAALAIGSGVVALLLRYFVRGEATRT
jgi:UDP-N-acetylmuramyl pentapeptide phosphotransferase/UDP-N-acetylglucosamine-1-phosphate transferase